MATDTGQQKESPKKRAGDLLRNADRLLKAGQHKEALLDIEQALELDPRNAFALAYQQRIKSLIDQAPKTASTAPVPVAPTPSVVAPKAPLAVEVKEAPTPAVDPEEAKKPIRKLAAIMFTDIVGYTALTQKNETLSLEVLEEHRKLLRPVFSIHEGKEIKTLGDSFMVEFTSVLHAVRCALSVQETILQYNDAVSEERQLQLRIGVHLGDVVYQENDIFGDGVNIASRLQERADPGGICISQDVYSQIRSRDEFRTEYVGEVELKNVLTPIPLYKVLTKGEHTQRTSDAVLRKTKEEAVLEARNKKLMEYVKGANDLIVKGVFNSAIIEVMKLQALIPGHHEIRDLEERVRKGKRAQASADFDEKKKVPKESILEMYSGVIEEAYSEGELTFEESDILENLRKSLNITRDEHLTLVQKFQK